MLYRWKSYTRDVTDHVLTHAALPHLLTDWEVRQQPQCGCCFTLSRRWRLCGSRYNFRTLHQGGSPVQLSNITGGSPLQLSNTRAGSPIQVPNTTPRGGLLFNFRTLHYERVSCTTSEHHGRISYTTSEHYTTKGSPAYNPGLVLSLWDIKKISKWYFLDLKSKLRKIPKNDWARDDWE